MSPRPKQQLEVRLRIAVVGGDVQTHALRNAIRQASKGPKRMRRRGDVGCPTALWAAGPDQIGFNFFPPT